MSAISPILKQTILELQNLPSISQFALGGGTNLALRYDHRISNNHLGKDFPEPKGIKIK